jgi:EpsI family protein
MGPILRQKVVVLVLALVLTCFVIYGMPHPEPVRKKSSLRQNLLNIEGWRGGETVPLDAEILKALDLDDYANQGYSNGQGSVFLYIGYYLSNKKIGAAHDPLVCFPGQGWVTSNIEKRVFTLDPVRRESVYSSVMTVQKGMDKQLIIYWFQSCDLTASSTFQQKLNAFWNRLRQGREDNAFVRLSISLQDKSLNEANDLGYQFIQSFYPVFLNYVRR